MPETTNEMLQEALREAEALRLQVAGLQDTIRGYEAAQWEYAIGAAASAIESSLPFGDGHGGQPRLGSWHWQVVGGRLVWDEEMCRIYGLEPGSRVSFEIFLGLVHPEDRVFVRGTIERSLVRPAPFHYEHRIIRPDGQVRLMECRGHTIGNEDDKAIAMFGTGVDITEKRAYVEMRERERELHRSILSHTLDGVLTFDTDGRITTWNRRMEQFTGISFAEAIGADVRACHPSFREEPWLTAIQKTFEGESVILAHLQLFAGEAAWYDISLLPILSADGTITGSLAVLHDVTERLRAEKELARMRDYYLIILEEFPALIWRAGLDAKCDYFNQTWLKFTGRTLAQEQGDGWAAGIHPEDLQKFVDTYLSHFTRRKPFDMVYRLRRHDGAYRFVFDCGRPYYDADGEFAGYIGACYDITERMEAEKALKERNIQLHRSNQELEQFAYVSSHDLKEPLRMIASYTQLLARHLGDDLDDTAEEYLQFCTEGAQRMGSLINDLLEYSRVGRVNDGFAWIDSREALDSALKNLSAKIQETGAELVVGGDLPRIYASRTNFIQLFQNLVSNALKFRSDRPLRIEISAERREQEWLFRIRDNGIGMQPEHLERIFVIFQRLHTRDKYPGTGIGLAICKKIAEHHGGKIWAESTTGEGTTFCFTAPG